MYKTFTSIFPSKPIFYLFKQLYIYPQFNHNYALIAPHVSNYRPIFFHSFFLKKFDFLIEKCLQINPFSYFNILN